MSRITPTQVMIERCDQLARDPKHLKRLMDFWPVENIVHRMAKLMLEELERNAALEERLALVREQRDAELTTNQQLEARIAALEAREVTQ